jgi:hypothetical protein
VWPLSSVFLENDVTSVKEVPRLELRIVLQKSIEWSLSEAEGEQIPISAMDDGGIWLT